MMVGIETVPCNDCGNALGDEEATQFIRNNFAGQGMPLCESCKNHREEEHRAWSESCKRNAAERLAMKPLQRDDINWQDTIEQGEPMDIAWQLLKAALFAPKSGHRDEENYPTRAAKKPPAQPPAGPSRWSEKARSEWARYADKYDQEHFFNRVGVAGGGQRAANFRESLPGSAFYTEDEEGNPVTHSVQSNAMWPSDPGEEGVKDAGRRYWSGDKMRNLLIEPQRKPKHFGEGTRVESWDETMARQREANKLIEQMGLTQRIPQSEGGARQEMRPGWKFGAGGRKEETEVGDEAWDKIRLPEGMTHIQEGHEGSDDWWKDAKPIDWRGEGEA